MDKITQILEYVVRCKYFEACVHIENPIMNLYQIEEEDLPSNLSGEIFEGTNIVRERVFVSTTEVSRKRSHVTMNPPGGGGIPPSIPPIPPFPPIDPLVRPRGLPIVVPSGLALVDIPSNLPNVYGINDEDLSRHMERFIERVISYLITNQRYWLVWFPTILEGEAYEWYRDHDEVILDMGSVTEGVFE